ncbi:three-Cys-motif partner protein TcmP [Acetivibrio saccincola]|uniref:three-Cys-motif partner protein TcmP n=1 Tax=Acetivibrio saccincola TaxID=1677857 RepID=UPI0016BCFA6A|nr:three-Cys-motif partner protein TcmP [Acetivibrio saccincola]NLW25907.1 three-Cys-motif partner protein TcmP [Acetivibrio saccincola]
MGKIYKDGYDFFFWNYEGQTKMKHEVLEEYVDKWVKIVGCYHKLNYFDCFGGCGAYIENDNIYYGSPIRVAEAVQKNQENLNRKVNIVIIEKEEENIENLKKVFEHNKIAIKPYFIQGDFDEKINKILDSTNGNLAPTFFFIDPFGFKINYETLKRIMFVPKSEIFLNFMFTRINEFLSAEKIEKTLDKLFGCSDWRVFKEQSNSREQDIVTLYRRQLKKFSKFVYYYRMSFPNRDRTYYYLFHLTNHYKGCAIMKAAFAKFNYGKVEYMGPKHGQMSLFEQQNIKYYEIKQYLLGKYHNTSIRFCDIIEENIDEVPYLESDIRNALKELREESNIEVKPISSKTRKGIQDKDLIIFS